MNQASINLPVGNYQKYYHIIWAMSLSRQTGVNKIVHKAGKHSDARSHGQVR